MKEFLTIPDLSEYLSIKKTTLYSMVESGEIPHYRIGRLICFKMSDVEAWMENHRQDPSGASKKAREILKAINRPVADVNQLVKKTIAEVKKNRYTFCHGRPDRIRDLGKEVKDGAL